MDLQFNKNAPWYLAKNAQLLVITTIIGNYHVAIKFLLDMF